jgi:esterase/lipase superfamily enzyme
VSATNYPGRVYMYSWPSTRSTFGYIGDLDNAEQAEPFLQSFLRLLMRDADIDEIDVLVHSMGSQPVLRALSALRAVFETQRQGTSRPKDIRIGQIILAAPDVAMPVFDQKIQRIAPFADRVTVYASAEDAALSVSRWLRGGPARTGTLNDNGEPVLIEIKNVHVIDATRAAAWWRLDQKLFGFGHDYFTQSPSVLADIREILKATGTGDRLTPKQRSSTRFSEVPFKNNTGGWVYWKLKD